jgi:hypothetical protein
MTIWGKNTKTHASQKKQQGLSLSSCCFFCHFYISVKKMSRNFLLTLDSYPLYFHYIKHKGSQNENTTTFISIFNLIIFSSY